jgi:NAD(P)-dependent dehydrogenase (short-subunit alcohol dehydrogenase family)
VHKTCFACHQALGAGNFGTRWGHGAERNQARKVFDASSWGHRFSPVVFDDPNYQRREYGRFTAYGQSKTENILFAVALDECGKAAGVGAFSLHPCSIVSTDLKREFSDDELRSADVINEKGEPVLDPARPLKTVEQGAATQVWCATSPQLDGKGASIARIVRWPEPCPQAKSTSGTWEIRLARLA